MCMRSASLLSLIYQARPTYGQWQIEHFTTIKLQNIKLFNATNSDTHKTSCDVINTINN